MKERDRTEHPALLTATEALLSEVEQLTGRTVEIRSESAIRGRGRAIYVVTDPDPTRHLILYDPQHQSDLDHLVAHECGHIQRFALAAPSDRTVAVMTSERRAEAT